MKEHIENTEFEKKYKEHMNIDTPDLWSRIEAEINDSQIVSSKEINKLTNKSVNKAKKVLSIVACASIVFFIGINLLGKNHMNNSKDQSLYDDTPRQGENPIQSVDKSVKDSENGNNDIYEETELSTYIKVIRITKDVEDTYKIKAILLNINLEPLNDIDIYASKDIANTLSAGEICNVILTPRDVKNEYDLKEKK